MPGDNTDLPVAHTNNKCQVCKVTVKKREQAVNCNKCKFWLHATCINMQANEYNTLKKTSKLKNSMWFCDNCLGEVTSIVDDPTVDPVNKLLTRISTLETTIQKLEKSLQVVQTGQLSYDENFDEIVERKVREYMDESKEVEKRKMNLVINGIPESNDEDAVIRKEEDRDKVRNLFQTLGVEPTELSDLTGRLGKVTDRFPSRSLLISVKSTRAKGDVMKAQTSYRQRNPTRKIYIAPDLSPKQRETNRVLVAEFKRRKDNGKQIKIRNGKIVKFNELPPDGADARHRSNSLASDN